MNNYKPVIQAFLQSPYPEIRYKILTYVLDEMPQPGLQESIRGSEIVGRLLSERQPDGKIPRRPYEKWRGAHWVLNILAELDYPPGDAALIPLREQALGWIFSPEVRSRGTPLIKGLYRRHASQEGNLLYALIKLGLADERLHDLAAILVETRWPDGGWNCDRKPQAHTSSFVESLTPLRGLIYYRDWQPESQVARVITEASEFFLQRTLYLRKSTGELISERFVKLTYPNFYFYTFLFALKVMAEGGFLLDPRCKPALDLIESKFIPGQGWWLEQKNYHYNTNNKHRCSLVRWGDFKLGRAHLFLTVEALGVLKSAGRIG